MIRYLTILLASLASAPAAAQDIVAATYAHPSSAYGHGAVEGGEYDILKVTFSDGVQQKLRLKGAVYEDTAPRLVDLDHDGDPEVVAVISSLTQGAMISVIDVVDGMAHVVGRSEPIGQRNRWLAIAGIGDMDRDGTMEIAYVDRPHLAKVLRLVTVQLEDGVARFELFAQKAGLTNHHYGAAQIEGGFRDCPDERPTIITADADWTQIMETRWTRGMLTSHAVGPYEGPHSFTPFLTCD